MPGVRTGAAALALLVATPLLATVWTRANLTVRIPKGGRVELENASYRARDWSVALTALEVREESRPSMGSVTTVWTFHYTNTDKEPHHVTLKVRCLDAKRGERSSFSAQAVLQADRPDGAKLEISAKMREGDWNISAWARVVVDFLSGPEG
ncbi:hypothetical protein FBQ97_13510 [Acidobacteria bacterium ACD]|nr:hypothetical protein [Acidobacteria bacterium ACD]